VKHRSLLCGRGGAAVQHLLEASMDNGMACESVHEDTGECMTGAAFATCAGFLAFSLFSFLSQFATKTADKIKEKAGRP